MSSKYFSRCMIPPCLRILFITSFALFEKISLELVVLTVIKVSDPYVE